MLWKKNIHSAAQVLQGFPSCNSITAMACVETATLKPGWKRVKGWVETSLWPREQCEVQQLCFGKFIQTTESAFDFDLDNGPPFLGKKNGIFLINLVCFKDSFTFHL